MRGSAQIVMVAVRAVIVRMSMWTAAVGVLYPVSVLQAADFSEAREAFYRGDYESCQEITRADVEKGVWNDLWSRQLIQCLLATGDYEQASSVYEQVAPKFSNSIPLRVLAAEAYRYAGAHEQGDRLLQEIPDLVRSEPWRYTNRDNMLAIGRYLLQQGEDAREILAAFYDRSLRSDSKFVDAHVAIAELALDKSDFQEAAHSLKTAVQLRPQDPDIHYLLARAWEPSDPKQASEHLQAALERNPKHSLSLLFQAENRIDSEEYEEAEELVAEVLSVNESHPLAWALRAAIAHLRGEYKLEGEYRTRALATWSLNPHVDYLIGKVLSQHYRFQEGIKYQRRALRLSPTFMPAKFQLAQDLLRVGADDEGWSIVDQVASADQYNVVAYNLKTLQERLSQFATLETSAFIVRMDAREARIYGDRVVELLHEAKDVLTEKYDHELALPVTVEIFPQQSDFAIRTFGLPGGAGFLGVCFGSLITANSPASQGEHPSNWESVLWHEFCHVVTLQKTKNRMPRWLSEGISVYEELQRDASWGQRMSPLYKEMLLGEDFVPLSDLSGAFLRPKSSLHLQFAYFQSSLAVRYLIEEHGLELLQQLLVDLGMGVPIEQAFARRYGDAQQLDADYRRFIEELADAFHPETEFDREAVSKTASVEELQGLVKEHPNNYFAQRRLVETLVRQQAWEAAMSAVQRLLELYPDDSEPSGGLDLLSTIARELGDEDQERESLRQLADLSSDHVPALLRLITLMRTDEQWKELQTYASKLLAVQPLIPTGHEAMIAAARRLQQPALAARGLEALQEMDPLDPAGLHFELAEMLLASGRTEEARREVLWALEQTPRYREAQQLLVNIYEQRQDDSKIPVARPEPGSPPSPAAAAAR